MHRSERATLIFLVFSLLVACTKADQKPDGVNGNQGEESTATFLIKSISGGGERHHVNAKVELRDGRPVVKMDREAPERSSWRIPEAASFVFTACIEDRASGSPARGHKFEVQIPEKKSTILDVLPTRPDGCFTWMETIPFSFFVKNSRWVVVERDIVGTGVHSGRRRVRLAINPWAVGKGSRDDGPEVLFLRDKMVPQEQLVGPELAEKALSGELQGQDELLVDSVSIQSIRKSERMTGTFVQMNIDMEPKVRFEDAAGEPGWYKIKSGEFAVVAHLVVSETGPDLSSHYILGAGKGLEGARDEDGITGFGRVEDGKLILRLNTWIEEKFPQGNLRLALRLIPKGVRGLAPFEGIYELGALRNLSSSYSGDLIKECRDQVGGCQVSTYLKSAENYKAARKEFLEAANTPYLFDRVNLRYIQVLPYGETATQRIVAYRASTCVVDRFTGEKVVGMEFKIHFLDNPNKPPETKKTLADGCLSWNSEIWHEYYQPEQFFEIKVALEKSRDFKQTLKFYINPWDDKFTFGFDEADFPAGLRRQKKIKSRFFLADYGYHTVRFQYNIDSLMALDVRKTVLMELQPMVLRYSGIVDGRKMTEPLRDGIYLMKVAIQKNYLDPATAGVVVDQLQDNQTMLRLANETPDKEARRTLNRLREMGIHAKTKEYISTQTTLVRVTDGVIIQPVELTMQDLRMMRMRANFLIQLEPVDEHKLWAHNKLQEGVGKSIDQLLETNKKLNQLQKKMREENLTDGERERLQKEISDLTVLKTRLGEQFYRRLEVFRKLFQTINEQLSTRNTYSLSLENFDINPDHPDYQYIATLFKELDLQMSANDFTSVMLPSCYDINCDDLVDVDSGLDKRTFVGPVIFIHNGYKDSVRATDNLDEANCDPKLKKSNGSGDQRAPEYDEDDEEVKKIEEKLRVLQRKMFLESEDKVKKERHNTLYKHSEYFGSLRHLCYKDVDYLIRKEREDLLLYEKSGPAVASIYNFANTFKLNFLSLADERLKHVEATPENITRCNYDLVSCMEETSETLKLWIPTETALNALNQNLRVSRVNMAAPFRWFVKNPDDVKPENWTAEDFRSALFDTKENASSSYDSKSPRALHVAACSLMTYNMVESVHREGGQAPVTSTWDQVQNRLFLMCLNDPEALMYDRKLRVFKTGDEQQSYIFLGGMQLNLNVGQSFSVSRSESWSWSYGAEGFDFIAWGGKAMGGINVLLKPFNLKLGKSHGMSSSEGTSISDSTYLVSQIAGFNVQLEEYERCVIMRFNTGFARRAFGDRYMNGSQVVHVAPTHMDSRWVRMNSSLIDPEKGVLVCEGVRSHKPKTVKESYYYFTQHFTEGDMLDQADLYNHPWLLALRGQRDFGVFLSRIRQQEGVSLGNFINGVWNGSQRKLEWPLEHMLQLYKKITPSWPGFYTELDPSEFGTELPLERSMSKVDKDINCEAISSDRRKPDDRCRPAANGQ